MEKKSQTGLWVALSLLLLVLVGGVWWWQTNKTKSETKMPIASQREATMLFEGVIPCADCQGIKLQLELESNGVYKLAQEYLGVENGLTQSTGTWVKNGQPAIYTLTNNQGEQEWQFMMDAQGDLQMLDKSGSLAESGLNYTLFKQTTNVNVGQQVNNSQNQDKKTLCENAQGVYDNQWQECSGIDATTCNKIGGDFVECGSACRHNPDAEICTMQCVIYCQM